jgi:hypothetical protein
VLFFPGIVLYRYKFRPASNNPYFTVPTEDYDMEEVLIGSTGINEAVKSRRKNSKRVLVDDDDESDDDEGNFSCAIHTLLCHRFFKSNTLITGMVFFPSAGSGKVESSHDLD